MSRANYFRYAGENARNVMFPLGAIGAGSIGLGGDGRLRDWEIYNRPSKGSVNGFSHFAVRAEQGGACTENATLGLRRPNQDGSPVECAAKSCHRYGETNWLSVFGSRCDAELFGAA